ncbi:hypothetical protein AAVH_26654 [Aphelenchoides avenae]|nr:hypothetical protein AAVH_26654 [Aphelenchus avenae]
MISSDEKVLRIPMKDHLWEWSLATDVTFVFHVFQGTGTKQRKHMHDVVFPAHRDLLITASPYFERLLADDWKPTDEVSIEDCQPGAFRILLRWIYGDEAILGNVRSSTYIPLLLVAVRFDVQDLVNRLLGLAEQLSATTDGFLYKVLDTLEQ